MNKTNDRLITIVLLTIIILALFALHLQGDPCDSAADPAACAAQLPER
jgi:Tfp pilus assembly protein PilV